MDRITNFPKVSIIVPVYNVEKYLHKCIDSILNQTFRNFELILVDDGSTDKSRDICDEYALTDKRIQVVHKKNEGVSVARNIGIEMSIGDWCCFIDSDDYIRSSYLESFILNLSDDVYFYMDRGYNIDNGYKIYYQGIPKEKKITSMTDLYYWGEFFHVINSPCMKLFSTKLIKDNNVKFNKELSYGEDHLFVLDYLLSLKTFDGLLIEDDGYYYLKEQDRVSLTTSLHSSEKIYLYAVESYEKRKKLIEQNKILDLNYISLVEEQTKVYLLNSAINTIRTIKYKNKEFEKIINVYCKYFKTFPWTTSRYYNLIVYSLLNLSYKNARRAVLLLSFFLQLFKFK